VARAAVSATACLPKEMEMPRALIHFDLPDADLERLVQRFPQVEWARAKDRGKVGPFLREAEILLVFLKCDRDLVEAAPRLQWIQAITAGVDGLPLDLIAQRGIRLTNGRGIHAVHMAEYAIAAMINLARGFHLMLRNQLRRKWDRSVSQTEICGATVGILGLGAIGREIARKADFMGMRVIGVRRTADPLAHVAAVYGPEEMDLVFRQSDYVINLLPATPATERLIDRRFFEVMKPTASFINLGRGQTVNETDLIEALRQRRIQALVTDVYETEPLPAESPLWEMENAILTPHIGGVSPHYMARAMEIIEHNLEVYLSGQGEMMNTVDLAAGY
jgi:phosphoglycerate dehydrogenase-like enzyme